MTKQDQKYHLSMAGEFFVAAELQRRGVSAAVTYGNAKSADVIAFSATDDKAVVIEVKSTSQTRWVVSNHLPESSSKPWVLVYLPEASTEPHLTMSCSSLNCTTSWLLWMRNTGASTKRNMGLNTEIVQAFITFLLNRRSLSEIPGRRFLTSYHKSP